MNPTDVVYISVVPAPLTGWRKVVAVIAMAVWVMFMAALVGYLAEMLAELLEPYHLWSRFTGWFKGLFQWKRPKNLQVVEGGKH